MMNLPPRSLSHAPWLLKTWRSSAVPMKPPGSGSAYCRTRRIEAWVTSAALPPIVIAIRALIPEARAAIVGTVAMPRPVAADWDTQSKSRSVSPQLSKVHDMNDHATHRIFPQLADARPACYRVTVPIRTHQTSTWAVVRAAAMRMVFAFANAEPQGNTSLPSRCHDAFRHCLEFITAEAVSTTASTTPGPRRACLTRRN